MRLILIALAFTALLAIAHALQAIFESAVAGWVGFGAIFALCLGWSLGLLPSGGGGLGDGD